MKRVRMIDPLVRATSFAARRGGMRDAKKTDRRLQKVEQRVAPVREDVITPEDWSQIEEVETQPEADEDIVGRIFLTRNEDADDVLSAGITAADGEPILVGLSTTSISGSLALSWQSILATGLPGVSGVSLDPSGNIYVYHNNSSQKYSPALSLLWTGFSPLYASRHMATDGTSAFYVDFDPSTSTRRINKRLASTGAVGSPSSFGSAGTGNGQFGTNGPYGLYFDGTNIWVVDTSNNRVQKFLASTGAYVSQFDGSTSGLAFDSPYDICSDSTSTYLYVLDSPNARVVKFDKATHAFVAEILLGGGEGGSADGQIAGYAQGIAVDSQGRIWVADTGNHRVQVYDGTGVFLAKIGSYGGGDGKFKSPKQLAISSTDVVYVADSGNSRIVTLQEDTGLPIIRSTVGGTVASGAIGTVDATCLTGEHVISGGHKHLSGNQNINNHESYPVNSTTWRCSSFNGTASGVATMVTCYAMCAKN